jgi:hypothetical protein
MPLQNRVTPVGDIVADPARGLFMGNRGGAFHSDDRTLGRRRWASRRWICCRLDFKGRRRTIMAPRSYTELFFLDEATALAAGHRPCFECRRDEARRFQALWADATGRSRPPSADEMDRLLHAERLGPTGTKRTSTLAAESLPDGAIFRRRPDSLLCTGGRQLRWSMDGYAPTEHWATGPVEVLTPPTILRILRLGYAPSLHPTALA